jgi:hypothetical protein
VGSPKIQSFNNHPLLESCLASLIPYFEMKEPGEYCFTKLQKPLAFSEPLIRIDNVLANFEEPGKINLADYMERILCSICQWKIRLSHRKKSDYFQAGF